MAFVPRFTISNAITAAFTKIERARGFLDAARLSEDWIAGMQRRALVLEAGVTQFQHVHVHPFVDGNGRTARLLSTLGLYRKGYDFKRLFTVSEYYDRVREAFYAAVPHLVRSSKSLPSRDWNLYALASRIEVERHRKKIHLFRIGWPTTISGLGRNSLISDSPASERQQIRSLSKASWALSLLPGEISSSVELPAALYAGITA
jgi:N-acetylglutamate synthase-like GNAT family acetyltransferase